MIAVRIDFLKNSNQKFAQLLIISANLYFKVFETFMATYRKMITICFYLAESTALMLLN